jgi:hypothetical protein
LTNGTSGSNGIAGGTSSIGINGSSNVLMLCTGGPRGLGGTLFAGGGVDSGPQHYFFPTGSNIFSVAGSSGGYGAAGNSPWLYPTPQAAVGAGGGGISASADFAGGSIINYPLSLTSIRMTSKDLAASAVIVAGGNAGLNGSSSSTMQSDLMNAGAGGGGGGGGFGKNAGNGGNGYRGSGGGGGGASSTGFNAGNGGSGGNGYCCIEAYQ